MRAEQALQSRSERGLLGLRLAAAVHCAGLKTFHSVSLRSGMRTGVWPWKVPCFPPGQSAPRRQGEGRLQHLVRLEAVPGAGGRSGGFGRLPTPHRGNMTAPVLSPLPLFLHLSNGRIFFILGSALDGCSLESSVSLRGRGAGQDKGRVHHCTCSQTTPGHQVRSFCGLILVPLPQACCLERDRSFLPGP